MAKHIGTWVVFDKFVPGYGSLGKPTTQPMGKAEAQRIAAARNRETSSKAYVVRKWVHKRDNPTMKRAPSRSGWMKATAVKFVTRNGKRVVLVRKPGTKRRKR